jgi:hypothetical protein
MAQRLSRKERQLRIPEACRQILEYLVENPHAGDTADGIVQWWLMQQRLIEAQEAVQSALDRLVAQDWILTERAADAQMHYRLNREKSEELHKYLQDKNRQ